MSSEIIHWKGHGTLRSYIIGFILSIGLTLIAYYLVMEHFLSGKALIATIIGFGIIQALVQLLFFLHLGQESKPRWNLLVFLFMVLVVLILVLGSLWIMFNLDERMMSGMEMEKVMLKKEGIYHAH